MAGGYAGGLIPKGTPNSADIKNPSVLQAQLHRDEAANGSGTYYGKLDDGTEEVIGGPGAGFIDGGGTLNFIPKFTPDGNSIGNSQLFDNGTSIGFDTIVPDASATFDISSTTQGFLVPRMTTVQRDAIVAPATGLLIYNITTSLFNFWTGAAWLEIDSTAGGDISGGGTVGRIPKFTGATTIGDSIITELGGFIGINEAAPTATLHVTGTFRYVDGNQSAGDILTSDANGNATWQPGMAASCWLLDGNTNGAERYIGTDDAFSFPIRTNNIEALIIDTTQNVGIGVDAAADTRVHIRGVGATNASTSFLVENSTPITIFQVRNDGYISAGILNGSLTIGLNSYFSSAVARNTFIGIGIGGAAVTGEDNTALGHQALGALTGGANNTAVGVDAGLNITNGLWNTLVGYQAGAGLTTTSINTFIGYQAGLDNVGTSNVAVGQASQAGANTGGRNVSVGNLALQFQTESDENQAFGYRAGQGVTTGDNNLFVGAFAGQYNTTQSNEFFIDNQDRTNRANTLTNSLVYGSFAATTASQFWRHNSNVGIGTNTFGANSDFVFSIVNGTAPAAAVANQIQIYSTDSDDNTATLGLFLEQAVEAIGTFTESHKVKVRINGTLYWISLDAV